LDQQAQELASALDTQPGNMYCFHGCR